MGACGEPEGAAERISVAPRSRKVLELALREAIVLGFSAAGTEHMLLPLIREDECVAAGILRHLVPDADPEIRNAVIRALSDTHPHTLRTEPVPFQATPRNVSWLQRANRSPAVARARRWSSRLREGSWGATGHRGSPAKTSQSSGRKRQRALVPSERFCCVPTSGSPLFHGASPGTGVRSQARLGGCSAHHPARSCQSRRWRPWLSMARS
jgi:hypothetical protein